MTFNDQLLYFTSSSVTADDARLMLISDRAGDPNLFEFDIASGTYTQLSHNTEGVLKSYVYFDGTPYRGLGKASPSLHAESGTLYYIQGRAVMQARAGVAPRMLAELPHGQMTAFTHVSADGARLCVPTTDARALDGDAPLAGRPAYDIDARVQAEGLNSYLRVYDTASGRELMCERVPRCWITHVQFNPRNADQILYNHEWPAACGIRRMWLFDGARHIALRREGDGRSRDDWTCHEMWERDGSAVIYHGTYADGRPYIGRVRADGADPRELVLPTRCTRYGHFTVGEPGTLVTDGYFEADGDRATFGGDWISRLDVDWERGTIDWTPLCRTGSSWASQDAHPHPIFDHAMRHICFTTDASGAREVRRISADYKCQGDWKR